MLWSVIGHATAELYELHKWSSRMHTRCKDCREHSYGAMFQNAIWKEAGMKRGLLCFPCMEKRLGRRLKEDDLVWCPLTWDDLHVIKRFKIIVVDVA